MGDLKFETEQQLVRYCMLQGIGVYRTNKRIREKYRAVYMLVKGRRPEKNTLSGDVYGIYVTGLNGGEIEQFMTKPYYGWRIFSEDDISLPLIEPNGEE